MRPEPDDFRSIQPEIRIRLSIKEVEHDVAENYFTLFGIML